MISAAVSHASVRGARSASSRSSRHLLTTGLVSISVSGQGPQLCSVMCPAAFGLQLFFGFLDIHDCGEFLFTLDVGP